MDVARARRGRDLDAGRGGLQRAAHDGDLAIEVIERPGVGRRGADRGECGARGDEIARQLHKARVAALHGGEAGGGGRRRREAAQMRLALGVSLVAPFQRFQSRARLVRFLQAFALVRVEGRELFRKLGALLGGLVDALRALTQILESLFGLLEGAVGEPLGLGELVDLALGVARGLQIVPRCLERLFHFHRDGGVGDAVPLAALALQIVDVAFEVGQKAARLFKIPGETSRPAPARGRARRTS